MSVVLRLSVYSSVCLSLIPSHNEILLVRAIHMYCELSDISKVPICYGPSCPLLA